MNEPNSNNRMFRISRVLFCVMVGLVVCGGVCRWVYDGSYARVVEVRNVTRQVQAMERQADAKIAEMERALRNGRVDSLLWIPFEKLRFTYLVYERGELIFWSDNQTEPENRKNTDWEYAELSNILALTKSKPVGDYNIVAYIPLKYNYPYENKELQNGFVEPLKIPHEVTIITHAPADKYAVFGTGNRYLFTLQLPEQALYAEGWTVAAVIFFLLAYLLFFFLFARFPLLFNRTLLSRKHFLLVSFGVAVFVFASLWFNFPAAFFLNKTFTPYHYASSPYLSTLTHLSFLSVFLLSLIYLFYFHVKNEVSPGKLLLFWRAMLLIAPGLFFVLIFNFLIGVVFNSSTEINILRYNNITFVSVWNHLLFLMWAVSFMMLRVKVFTLLVADGKSLRIIGLDVLVSVIIGAVCYVLFPKYGAIAWVSFLVLTLVIYLRRWLLGEKRIIWFRMLWLFLFTLFFTGTSIYMNKEKKFEKYRILAENHYASEDTEEVRIAISLLSDLNRALSNDSRIAHLAQFPDSMGQANEYINNTYLRGFWSKYEMRLFGISPDSEWETTYQNEIDRWGKRVKLTNFYVMGNPKSDLAFLGAFRQLPPHGSGQPVNLYLEFYPRKMYKSYSFPDLLIENPPSIQSQLSLSSARYAYRELVSMSGKFPYRTDAQWIEKNTKSYFKQRYNGYTHYIYVPDVYNYYVLSEKNEGGFWVYLLYFSYTFILYFSILFLLMWLYRLIDQRGRISYKFSSKYLAAYMVLLVLSFLSIFYVSVNYMQKKYMDEQKSHLESTKNYIQMALQEKYYWQENLDSTMTASLNFDLQDLSSMYQTDILVYDNFGQLIGSSQPALFSRELISRLMSPIVYFSQNENNNQYEKIGNLEYLTAYTNLYNGDFLQIGYIAIPQFLSGDLVQADLESFLMVIVHIYLIIIALFILLSLIITHQLFLPITLLQESLKEIKLGQRNKKIAYKPRDEIGQLVEQYNRTVDELEKSARRLAKSERESAWKTMARQVAHEINNPLTPMKLTIQHLQYRKAMGDERFDAYFEKTSEMLIEQIENLSKIAGTFSSFAKLPEPNSTKIDVVKKLKSVAVLFANNPEQVQVYFHDTEEHLFVFVDREQLILVFNNLMKNALQAIPAERAGRVDLRIESTASHVMIYFKDNGVGIPEEVKKRLFTPNFTTKSTGMGLGLSISRNIIRMMGGEITFETERNVGTEFKITLPRMAE